TWICPPGSAEVLPVVVKPRSNLSARAKHETNRRLAAAAIKRFFMGFFSCCFRPLRIKRRAKGCSVRSIERITGVHRDTVTKILLLVGERCERLLEEKIHGLSVKDVQCDEMWGFVGCKQKRNVTGDPRRGDAYCFVAIERTSKLVLTWHLGSRISY